MDFRDEAQREIVIGAVRQVTSATGHQVDVASIEHAWDVLSLEGVTSRQELARAGVGLSSEARFEDDGKISDWAGGRPLRHVPAMERQG